jgi:hypothetical protein
MRANPSEIVGQLLECKTNHFAGLGSTLLAHRACNSGEQDFTLIRTVVTDTVNEKRRRAVDPTAYSTHEILAHSRQIGMFNAITASVI